MEDGLVPPARAFPATWASPDGTLWMYGGWSRGANGSQVRRGRRRPSHAALHGGLRMQCTGGITNGNDRTARGWPQVVDNDLWFSKLSPKVGVKGVKVTGVKLTQERGKWARHPNKDPGPGPPGAQTRPCVLRSKSA